jgi:hypothetical protein
MGIKDLFLDMSMDISSSLILRKVGALFPSSLAFTDRKVPRHSVILLQKVYRVLERYLKRAPQRHRLRLRQYLFDSSFLYLNRQIDSPGTSVPSSKTIVNRIGMLRHSSRRTTSLRPFH